MFTGSCLCGSIQFHIHCDLPAVQICHCRQCQKAQGVPFASNIPVNADAFELVKGEDRLKEFVSTTVEGKSRHFCGKCGSPIYSTKADRSVFRVRAGIINEKIGCQISSHAYVDNQLEWCDTKDDAPRYPQARQ